MLEIEIDGKKLVVAGGSTVMDAARRTGIYIPYFCYHKNSPADCIRLAAAREETASLGAMFGTIGAERVAAQQKVTV